jgi:hypothetical protein
VKIAHTRRSITALALIVTALGTTVPAHAAYILMMQSRQTGGTKTIPGYTYQRCREAAESVDQSAVKAWCVPDPSEPTAEEIGRQQAEADRQASALRDAEINLSNIEIKNMTIGGSLGGGAVLSSGRQVPYELQDGFANFSATIVNHSNKTLRAIDFEIQAKDCATCRAYDVTAMHRISVSIPPGGEQSVDTMGHDTWRLVNDGKLYTWRLGTASACPWGWDAKLKCP